MQESKPVMTNNDVNYIRAIYVALDMLKLGIVDKNDFWEYEKRIADKYKIESLSIYRMTETSLNIILSK